ncbi:hypothetical protein CTAYLR_001559 [Chrysophaeum taylorii]|uniref:SprT-like domain-containing protein n=1 Tax=Chrysophaeum taylorii TaxID=2483200 RepID=A0AAD7XLL0_9STRA|nr:hypothetical protein CTAYLR_001559 [Chrysophaeum taylorii]
MGRLKHRLTPSDVAASLEHLHVTPRRTPRTPKPRPTPVSARRGGLDGDAWRSAVEHTKTPESKPSPDVLVIDDEDDDDLDDDQLIDDEDEESVANDEEEEEEETVDLEVPTPRRAAVKFAARRDAALADAFERMNRDIFDNQLLDVECSWSKRLRTTAGITRLRRRGKDRTAVVELATHVVDSDPKLDATLAHELCHAAAWVIDNVARPAHGRVFKAWARRVTQVYPHVLVTTTHRYKIAFKFKWQCSDPDCSYSIGRHSNSIDIAKHKMTGGPTTVR